MRKVAIIGTGHTHFVFNSPKTEIELFCEAVTEAMEEAGVGPKVYCWNIQEFLFISLYEGGRKCL